MSNFTYEIDERNLRLKMKEFTVPVKEDAWQKFESFSDDMVNEHRENRMKNFNFSLNRSVVLPSVFGVIIILFSFLLVNFVSIKNPSRVNEQKAEVKPEPVVIPEVLPNVTKTNPVAKAEIKPEAPVVIAAPAVEPKVEETTASTTMATKQEAAAVQPATSTEIVTDAAVEEAKARRAERRAARAAEKQKLQEISPTPISDEGDSEVRPD